MININECSKSEKQRLFSSERIKTRLSDLSVNKKIFESKIKKQDDADGVNSVIYNNLSYFQDMVDDGEIDDYEFRLKLDEAWMYMTYKLNPLFVPVYIINIVMDMFGMAKDAFLLMLENMTPKPKANENQNERNLFKTQEKTKEKGKTFNKAFAKGKAKKNQKDTELYKGAYYNDSYAKEMSRQRKEESSKAVEYGSRVAREVERNAGIFVATHSKGSGESYGWAESSSSGGWGYSPSFESEMAMSMY